MGTYVFERSLRVLRGARAVPDAYAVETERRSKSKPEPREVSKIRAMTPAAPTITGVIGYWFRERWRRIG